MNCPSQMIINHLILTGPGGRGAPQWRSQYPALGLEDSGYFETTGIFSDFMNKSNTHPSHAVFKIACVLYMLASSADE